MIEISISGLVLVIGIFFILGMALGIVSMIKCLKRGLDNLEGL